MSEFSIIDIIKNELFSSEIVYQETKSNIDNPGNRPAAISIENDR